MPTETPNVPEIWYKGQRVVRTIVAFLVTALPIANAVAAAVIDYLRTQQDVAVPPIVFVWLNAILVGSAFIIALVTRIMAVPGVNDILTKIGLGSVPRKAVHDTPAGVAVVAVDPNLR